MAQTAHNKTTAEDIYIGREGTSEDREELLSIYCNDLSSENKEPDEVEETPEDVESDKNSDLSEFESPKKQRPSPAMPLETLLPTNEPVVRRFNMVRPSINDDINPVRTVREPTVRERPAENRESMNSTLGAHSVKKEKIF